MADGRLENIENYSKYFKKRIESNATSSHYRLLKENLLSPIFSIISYFQKSFIITLRSLDFFNFKCTYNKKKTFVRQEKQIENGRPWIDGRPSENIN